MKGKLPDEGLNIWRTVQRRTATFFSPEVQSAYCEACERTGRLHNSLWGQKTKPPPKKNSSRHFQIKRDLREEERAKEGRAAAAGADRRVCRPPWGRKPHVDEESRRGTKQPRTLEVLLRWQRAAQLVSQEGGSAAADCVLSVSILSSHSGSG